MFYGKHVSSSDNKTQEITVHHTYKQTCNLASVYSFFDADVAALAGASVATGAAAAALAPPARSAFSLAAYRNIMYFMSWWMRIKICFIRQKQESTKISLNTIG